MRLRLLAVVSVPAFFACSATDWKEITDGGTSSTDQKCSAAVDLGPATAKCAAAKGLAGNNLACVDFNQVTDLTSDPKVTGWKFDATGCWEIAAGKLQVKSFKDFMGTCGLTLPPQNLADADKQKYQSLTLSVIHTLDLNKQRQQAGIYLGVALDTQQMWLGTGTNPRQVSTVTVAKAALPNGGNSIYQPLFNLTSTAQVGNVNQGWQIESIAVNASQ